MLNNKIVKDNKKNYLQNNINNKENPADFTKDLKMLYNMGLWFLMVMH